MGDTKVTGTKRTSRTKTGIEKYSNATQIISQIDQKLAKVRQVYSTSFRTSGDVKMPEISGTLKIKEITNVGVLIAIMGALLGKAQLYNIAVTHLKVTTSPAFVWQGYDVDAWTHDISLRIDQIGQNATEKELLEIRSGLQEFITKEDKLAMLTDRLTSILG